MSSGPWARAAAVMTAMASVTTAAAPRARADAPAPPSSPPPPTKIRCAEAFEAAQRFGKAGRLKEARSELRVCLHEACPAVVQTECTQLQAPLDASQPTVVVQVHDAAGADMERVRVYVDGALETAHLDGRAFEIDPGSHRLRFEGPNGERGEQEVLVREGEKNRSIQVVLRGPQAVASASAAAGSPAPVPVGAIVLGGVGVLGAASFAVFGLTGKAAEHHLEETCSPHCSQSDIQGVRTRYVIADISLGVAVVSLAASAVAYLTRRRAAVAGTGRQSATTTE